MGPPCIKIRPCCPHMIISINYYYNKNNYYQTAHHHHHDFILKGLFVRHITPATFEPCVIISCPVKHCDIHFYADDTILYLDLFQYYKTYSKLIIYR